MSVHAAPVADGLPELANVPWRPRVTDLRLRRAGRLWTLSTSFHTVPFLIAAVGLSLAKPVTIPVAIVLVAHAWVIPELYAARGAGVVRPGRRSRPPRPRASRSGCSATSSATRRARCSRARV